MDTLYLRSTEETTKRLVKGEESQKGGAGAGAQLRGQVIWAAKLLPLDSAASQPHAGIPDPEHRDWKKSLCNIEQKEPREFGRLRLYLPSEGVLYCWCWKGGGAVVFGSSRGACGLHPPVTLRDPLLSIKALSIATVSN